MLILRPRVLALRSVRGFSIIELMIVITVIAVFIALGLPAFSEFLQNTRLRTGAESMLAGIQVAKSEALRRNTSVRFQLMTDLSGNCKEVSNGQSWVVSLDDAKAACDSTPSDTKPPRILQVRSGNDGTASVVIQAAGGPNENHTLVFTGLGRLSIANPDTFTKIDISNPAGGTCQHVDGGKMRCLRIEVTPSGDARMCDPMVTDATDPRRCLI